MSDTAATGMPTDAELIQLLRQRVHRLETAVADYLDAMAGIGVPVREAWRRYDDPAAESGGALEASFLAAYRESLPKRRAAVEALVAAVTQDFRAAVLEAPDMTAGDRARWLTVCDAGAKEQGQ